MVIEERWGALFLQINGLLSKISAALILRLLRPESTQIFPIMTEVTLRVQRTSN